MSTEYSRVGLLAGHVHHIYASVPVYTVFAHAAAGQLAPALHMSCLVRGGSKLRRDLSEKAPLPGPLWPSYRAAEISDILAGSWWNLRRIGRTRLTDRMLILHACVPLSWMPSVIWSASTIFFFLLLHSSFFSQCWKKGREGGCREPCLRTALPWRGNGHNNRYRPHCLLSCLQKYDIKVSWYCVRRLVRSNRAACSVKPYGYYCVHLQQRPRELDRRRNGSLRDCSSKPGIANGVRFLANFLVCPRIAGPRSSTSNKDQDNLRGSINSNPRHPSLHGCRQGASCHLVVPCWLHAHAECVRRRLCFCSNRQSDPSVPIGQLTRLRLI